MTEKRKKEPEKSGSFSYTPLTQETLGPSFLKGHPR